MSETRTSIIGAILVALGPVSMSLYTPAMPELTNVFHTTEPLIKLTLSLYFGGFAFAQLISGPLSDALGRRKASAIFLTIFLLGSLLAAFAPNVEALMAGRLIQGIGSSVGMTVSRAIVRDQFSGAQSSRIMNMIGIMLAIGPAIAPTLGGIMLVTLGWQSIFYIMIGFGISALGIVLVFMPETTVPDRTRLHPGPLFAAYGEIFSNQRFITAALTIACSVGCLYALATILPFIMIDQVHLTPAEYGFGMLAQTGSFMTGSLVFRMLLKSRKAETLVAPGLVLIGIASVMVFLSAEFLPFSYLSVMVPVGVYAFGIAFVIPHMMTSALAPFPHIAGSASAVMGFAQMGSGLVTGAVSAIIGVPSISFQFVVPAMGLVAILSYVQHRIVSRAIENVPVEVEAEPAFIEAAE
jgi:DHA1 family bicyclomycin/chloramphenicol resistance-like MFS transporter